MEPVAGFFASNIIAIYFLYGLAFFALGLAVIVELGRAASTPFARVMAFLGPFGVVHGAGEWAEMFGLIAEQTGQPAAWHDLVSVFLAASSFVILMVFAVRLAGVSGQQQRWLPYSPAVFAGAFLAGAGVLAVWPLTSGDWVQALEILARNWLGLPASLMTCWALLLQRRSFLRQGYTHFASDLMGAAAAFACYAFLDQVVAERTAYFPGSVINAEVFLAVAGVPVQVFRLLSAVAASYFVIGLLRGFQGEIDRRLQEANESRLAVQAEALRANQIVQEQTDALNRELREATRELSALFETSRILASTLDLDTILRDSVAKIVTLLEPAGLGLIYLEDASDRELALASRSDVDAPSELALMLGDLTASQVYQTAQPVCCPQVDESGHAAYGAPGALGTTNVLGVPLMSQSRVIGALVMVSREGSPVFSIQDLPLVQALGSQLSIAVENARLYAEVAEKERIRGQLLDRAVSAQEDERKRIARELHDETGQALSGVLMGLTGVETAMASNPALARGRVNDLKAFTAQALEELRNLVADLRPVLLDDLGLVAALHWFANRYQERSGIEVELTVEGNRRRLDPRVETILFRVAQEAMTNTAKHAQARHVRLLLSLGDDAATLKVEDDGRGFDPATVLASRYHRPAWGLLGMQERLALVGGTFELWSKPGEGARVSVRAPLRV
jgi:signal transduction histidine kinase